MTEFHNQFEQQEIDLRKVLGPRKKESEDKAVQLIFGPGHRIVQPMSLEEVQAESQTESGIEDPKAVEAFKRCFADGHSYTDYVLSTPCRQAGFSFSGYQIRLPDGSIHDFGMDEAAYDAYVALFREDKEAAHRSIGWNIQKNSPRNQHKGESK